MVLTADSISKLAPFSNKIFTISNLPNLQAIINGVFYNFNQDQLVTYK